MARSQAAEISINSGRKSGQPKIDHSNDARLPATGARFVHPAKVRLKKLAATMFVERGGVVRVVTVLADNADPLNRRDAEAQSWERGRFACSFRRPAKNTSHGTPGQGLLRSLAQ